jgi:hypothetical protein
MKHFPTRIGSDIMPDMIRHSLSSRVSHNVLQDSCVGAGFLPLYSVSCVSSFSFGRDHLNVGLL